MSSFADISLDTTRDTQSMIRGCGVSRGDARVSLSAENDTVSFSLSDQDVRPIQPRVTGYEIMKICEARKFLISRDHSIYSAHMALGVEVKKSLV